MGLGTGGIGDAMQRFGLGYFVVQLALQEKAPELGSLYLGLLGLSQGVPGIVVGLFGGVLADRMERRRLLLLSRVGSMVVVLLLAALIITGNATVPPILLLSLIGAIATSIDFPTRQSLLSSIVPQRDLMSAVGLTQASGNAAMLVGPLVGGLLIIPLGVAGLMIANAVTSVATIVALVLLRPLPQAIAPRHESVLRSLADGIAYVAREPVLRWVIILGGVVGFFARPYIQLMPAFAAVSLGVGPVELSWLLAAIGFGTLAGSLISGSFGDRRRTGLSLAGSVLVCGAALVLFAFQRSLGPAMALLVVTAVCHFIFAGIAFTLMQTRTPDHLRGRAVAIFITTLQGLGPLGILTFGSLGVVVGVDRSLALGGLIAAVAGGAILLRVRALRDVGAQGPV